MNALSWRLMIVVGRLTRRLHVISPQTVCVNDCFLDADRILDLGGGGEGVIGRLRGRQVTAVDIRQDELDDAPAGPVKVVADARRLPFADASFEAATAFFFMMYVPPADRPPVLREAFRVLSPGGSLHVWDATIPAPGTRTGKTFVVPIYARLPRASVRTAYGVPWDSRALSAASLTAMACAAGFETSSITVTGRTFHLTLTRPLSSPRCSTPV